MRSAVEINVGISKTKAQWSKFIEIMWKIHHMGKMFVGGKR